ncbi:hypothetical protein UFOVP1004_41 [uncultured Caudovirales phage]|uniref:Uncharacterized protein n=1 Tax=uncultured Caudovirales phage TaxID=2100421 RepID=A0A6J5Q3G0_9CAUD|nr:hypothetical protein UFOVP1004_41 [uncultured Caudovirales phage]
MAITITAKLDVSGVKSGANEAAAAVDGLGQATASTSDQMANELLDTRNEIQKLTDEIEDLQHELDDMASIAGESFDEMGGSASEAGEALKAVGGGAAESRDKIKTVAVAYLAVVDVAKKVSELAKKAGEAIAWMAENGNPAAVELQESFKKVKQSILDIAEDPAFQDMMAGLAVTIREDVIPAIRAIPDAWVATQDFLEDGFAAIGESVGLFAEGTREAMNEMQEADAKNRALRQNKLAGEKEERKSKDSLTKVEEGLAKIEESRFDAAIQGALAQVGSEEELRDVIDDLTESIREQAKEGKLSDEERERGLKRIAAAEDRYRQVKADKEKAAADKAVKIEEDAAKEREKVAQEEADNKEKLAKEALDLERHNHEERKRLVMGGDVKGAEQLLGAQSREQVKEAYAQKKAEEAAGAFDASGASAKEVAAGRKRALVQARRQFDNGTADSADIRDAQVELAGKAADSAVLQGKSSKETAQATKEAIAELAKTQNELEQVQSEMAGIRSLMGGISQQGERRRAQVAGSRQ